MSSVDAGAAEIVEGIAAATRALRERSNLSLSQLAQRAGISKATLSGLEAGRANPSIETLNSIARALGVPIAELMAPPASRLLVIRAGTGARGETEESNYRTRLLDSRVGRGSTELYIIEQDTGPPHEGDVHPPGLVENIYVDSGRLRTGPSDAPVELGPGDFISFSADRPHFYEALVDGTRAIVCMSWP